MRRVHLNDRDLELLEEACRRLALKYRNDAKRMAQTTMESRFIEHAETFERLAERDEQVSKRYGMSLS